MKTIPIQMPLIYSCSGCSNVAQMANYIAIQLDRKGLAEMSCIVGVGGNIKKLVRVASSGRKIIVVDGCPLACSKACLANHAIVPNIHLELTRLGIIKRSREDFDINEGKKILGELEMLINKQFGEND